MITITFIFIILAIFCCLNPKSKRLCLIFFLFMWILWGWNSWNGDYDAYKMLFDSSNDVFRKGIVTEYGFNILNEFFLYLGFTFQGYMIVISFLVLFVFYLFAKELCPYPAMFSLIYFIIFIMEYVFTRNYITHTLLVLAILAVLVDLPRKKLIFLVLVLIGGLFHRTGLLFLPFYFLIDRDRLLNVKKMYLINGVILVLSTIFLGLYILPLLGNVVQSKFSVYESGGGFSSIFFAHLILVSLLVITLQKVLKIDSLTHKRRKQIIFIINFNLLSLFYLSLYYHVPYFGRFMRCLFTIDILYLLYAVYSLRKTKYAINSKIVLASVLIALFIMFSKSTLSLTFQPILKKNLIFGVEDYIPDLKHVK